MSDEIRAQIVSPEVDGSQVTFRLRAPSASEVRVRGIHGVKDQKLKKENDELWVGKVGPLPPERYSYFFEVDGTRMIDPSNRDVKKWLSLNSQFEILGGLLHEQMKVPHGVVHHRIYDSKSTGSERAVCIYTPPGYEDGNSAYPVLFLLHGYGDDHQAWLEVGRANFILDNLIADRKIQPLVCVMPYGHPLPIDLRKEFDDYADRNLKLMEKDLFSDLLPFIAKKYRVKEDRESHAIVGLSMGGGQSLGIGLKHLERFAIVGGFSSAAPQGSDEELANNFASLVKNVEANDSALELLWIACGKEDFLLERNNRFVEWLMNRKIQHQYELTDGGHDWMVWRRYLGEFLQLAFPPTK